MSQFLSDEDFAALVPAEMTAYPTPIPTRIVASEEFVPAPQGALQKQVERRIKALADEHGSRLGLGRRAFLRTAAGLAASFVAMNEIYGPHFAVSRAEAAEPDLARLRQQS